MIFIFAKIDTTKIGNKNLIPKNEQLINQDLFTQLSSGWKTKSNADKGFFEKDFAAKRDVLRKLALQPELEDILDTMSNEAIVYDSDLTYFATPFIEPQELGTIKKEYRKKIENLMNEHFRRFYKMLNWKYKAWDDFKRWLVEGILAYEIVYDKLDKPTRIIGIIPLDPATLTKKYEHNKWYWVQYKGIQGKERVLLDSQVIYVPFQETECINRNSYLERLIRPFNIYRIIEQAQLIWTITNSSYKMKFTIPVKGMNKTMGMQTLSSAMNRYKEDISFNVETGELKVNGKITYVQLILLLIVAVLAIVIWSGIKVDISFIVEDAALFGVAGTLLGAIIGGTFSLLGSVWINNRQQRAVQNVKRKNVINMIK